MVTRTTRTLSRMPLEATGAGSNMGPPIGVTSGAIVGVRDPALLTVSSSPIAPFFLSGEVFASPMTSTPFHYSSPPACRPWLRRRPSCLTTPLRCQPPPSHPLPQPPLPDSFFLTNSTLLPPRWPAPPPSPSGLSAPPYHHPSP
jgi:hypothetical protein